jgi:RNA binding exosome subunit
MGELKLRFRTFVHATEDEQKVAHALLSVMACEQESEGASRLEPSRLKGHHGNPILVLEAVLGKSKDVERAMHRWRTQAKQDVATIIQEIEARMDEEGNLHFRFDKQAAVEGRIALTRASDAIQVEARAPRHPGTDLAGLYRHALARDEDAPNNV